MNLSKVPINIINAAPQINPHLLHVFTLDCVKRGKRSCYHSSGFLMCCKLFSNVLHTLFGLRMIIFYGLLVQREDLSDGFLGFLIVLHVGNTSELVYHFDWHCFIFIAFLKFIEVMMNSLYLIWYAISRVVSGRQPQGCMDGVNGIDEFMKLKLL